MANCEKTFSCVDCGQHHCDPVLRGSGSRYPQGCLTTELSETDFDELFALYEAPENRAVMQAAAEVECDGYGKLTRVEEIMAFAKKLGYQKLGIATCAGLIQEAKTLARILRKHGFEVYGAICKVGAVEKTEIGIPERCMQIGPSMCNPILQAKKLNEAGTDLNIVVGLCVGHDSLFYKYSNALCTTMITKDRVLGHNPAAALYLTGCYYKRLLQEK